MMLAMKRMHMKENKDDVHDERYVGVYLTREKGSERMSTCMHSEMSRIKTDIHKEL